MHRKIYIIICCVLLTMVVKTDVFADSTPVVSAKTTNITVGTDIEIPVNISNNIGIMGYHFVIKYDPERIRITNVVQGDIIKNGVFNQNLGSHNNKVDIIWSGAEETQNNGTIFSIFVHAADTFKDKTTIKIAAVKDDIYNEQFKTIKVSCKEISLSSDSSKKKDERNDTEQERPEESFYVKEISEEVDFQLNDKRKKAIIEKVLQKNNLSGFKDVDSKTSIKVMNDIITEMDENGLDTIRLKRLIDQIEKNDELNPGVVIKKSLNSDDLDSSRVEKQIGVSIDVDKVINHSSYLNAFIIGVLIASIIALLIVCVKLQRGRK